MRKKFLNHSFTFSVLLATLSLIGLFILLPSDSNAQLNPECNQETGCYFCNYDPSTGRCLAEEGCPGGGSVCYQCMTGYDTTDTFCSMYNGDEATCNGQFGLQCIDSGEPRPSQCTSPNNCVASSYCPSGRETSQSCANDAEVCCEPCYRCDIDICTITPCDSIAREFNDLNACLASGCEAQQSCLSEGTKCRDASGNNLGSCCKDLTCVGPPLSDNFCRSTCIGEGGECRDENGNSLGNCCDPYQCSGPPLAKNYCSPSGPSNTYTCGMVGGVGGNCTQISSDCDTARGCKPPDGACDPFTDPSLCTGPIQCVCPTPTDSTGDSGGSPAPTRQAIDPTCDGGQGIETAIGCIPLGNTTQFASFFIRWGLGVGGGVALILIVFAGYQIISSAGNPDKLRAGKDLLTAAIAGLMLIIFSVFVLEIIGVRILQLPGFG